ncbi:DM13 domain-containing protein [Myxacorys almedinensis]|uniref:DM13 domain-containing protein n=1 Tax=Myxacorys almedinensis A TaxID=2690445 RepID=A0A8J8CP82_9CYAN|nr:DM13 domain-containing protein [Myxacorys almedinensis]NDJ19202.1 hypothetical protein [Myxacorys almedinensis A]
MKLSDWLVSSLAVVAISGCGQTASNQASEGPASSSVAPTLAQSSPSATVSAQSSPAAMAAGAPIASGIFASGEHPTQGTVNLITQDGKAFLELDPGFKTSEMGPDLVIALHRSANVLEPAKAPAYALKEGEYVVVAPLKAYRGAQRYEIPAGVNLADYKSAVIWCRKFNATFGSAKLGA